MERPEVLATRWSNGLPVVRAKSNREMVELTHLESPVFMQRVHQRRCAEVGGRPLYLFLFLGERRLLLDAGCASTVDEFIVPDFNLGGRERKLATLDRFVSEVAAGLR